MSLSGALFKTVRWFYKHRKHAIEKSNERFGFCQDITPFLRLAWDAQ